MRSEALNATTEFDPLGERLVIYVADATGNGHITIASGDPPLEAIFVADSVT
jgi:hypothetical protein